MIRLSPALLLVLGVVPALAAACNLDHPGEAPKRGKLRFPTAVAASAGQQGQPARYLFAANSNFDLAFNAGSLQVFDLDALDKEIAACDPDKECVIAAPDMLRGEVLIGSYATGITVSATGERIYVTTRGDSALTWADLRPERGADDILDCGQGDGRHCDDDHLRDERTLSTDDDRDDGREEMPGEPVGIITGPMSDFDVAADEADHYVMVAHRVGAVSLFLDHPDRSAGPELIGFLEGIRERITGIAFDPVTAFAYLTSVEASSVIQAKVLDRIGVRYAGKNSVLYDAGPIWLTGVSYDRDTRDVKFDAEGLPGKALVVARVPSSLIVADTEPSRVDLSWTAASVVTEVGSGASRVSVGRIGVNQRLFAFVSCFASRELFVIDTALGGPVAVVRGFSGPFDLALDRWRKRLYVADFRSSTVRIVDLRPVVCDPDDEDTSCDSARASSQAALPCRCLDGLELGIIATLGEPNLPTELL